MNTDSYSTGGGVLVSSELVVGSSGSGVTSTITSIIGSSIGSVGAFGFSVDSDRGVGTSMTVGSDSDRSSCELLIVLFGDMGSMYHCLYTIF